MVCLLPWKAKSKPEKPTTLLLLFWITRTNRLNWKWLLFFVRGDWISIYQLCLGLIRPDSQYFHLTICSVLNITCSSWRTQGYHDMPINKSVGSSPPSFQWSHITTCLSTFLTLHFLSPVENHKTVSPIYTNYALHIQPYLHPHMLGSTSVGWSIPLSIWWHLQQETRKRG